MSQLVSFRRTGATARRVLAQLRADRRTIALLLIVPSLLLVLLHQMLDSQPSFDRYVLSLLGIFPFTTMFLVTSVAMLRERTSGTLERLLTTPIGKLDLLLGYGIAFALAAAAQAVVSSMTVYWLLGLYTPGSPALVVVIAVVTAVLGMSLGLMLSAFATTEFQAVQFMPAVVTPQILLAGLFVPRDQMADWLHAISDLMPLTYSVEAMDEVGSTGVVTDDLLRDVGVVGATTIIALTLAATTLRRSTGAMTRRTRRVMVIAPLVTAVLIGFAVTPDIIDSRRYVSTDNARVAGDQVLIVAPATGTLVRWGRRARLHGGRGPGRRTHRDPRRLPAVADEHHHARGRSVVRNNVAEGTFVTVGTELAVACDLSTVHVTAGVDETEIDAVHVGQYTDVEVDAYPDVPLPGQVVEIRRGVAGVLAGEPVAGTTGIFERVTQVIPVEIALADRKGLPLLPGMSVRVRIRRG